MAIVGSAVPRMGAVQGCMKHAATQPNERVPKCSTCDDGGPGKMTSVLIPNEYFILP